MRGSENRPAPLPVFIAALSALSPGGSGWTEKRRPASFARLWRLFIEAGHEREDKMFAVIKTGGKQYRVAADQTLEVEKLAGDAGDTIIFDKVLMVAGEGEPMVGAPIVAGASVAGEIVEQKRGPKIIIFKKRRRKNSRRKNGHRQDLTLVRITDILTDGKKPAVKKAKAAPEKPDKSAKPEIPKTEAPKTEVPKTEAPKTEAPKAEAAKAAAKPAQKASDAAAPLFTTPAGEPDDLKKISGVGPVIEKKLHALGLTRYEQVAAFTAEDIARVDEALSFKGRIERDDWVAQAKALASDKKEG
jgi:large subunit ribosomal protein L21